MVKSSLSARRAVATVSGVVCRGAGVGACLDREPKPLTPCTVSGVVQHVPYTNVEEVDLLFVVDNSGSMTEEQSSLIDQFPRLVRVLASGDQDGDGLEDFPPVRSLQIGVVSTDMGTGGFRVPTCAEPNFGDDGILLTRGYTANPDCAATYPPFLGYEPSSGGDPAAFAQDVSCVATLGTNGCGFEQQLEAVLKAVTPSTSPVLFNMGTMGHADTANMGFVRPDSLLAVVVVTDEEDCSAADPELFNPASAIYAGDLNLRCFQYPGAVHPVQRFVDGLLATRPVHDLLVFATISGVPPRLVADADAIDFDAILAAPEMQQRIDPDNPTRLVPSCNVPGRGLAFPPTRIVELARDLERAGANGVVQSICQEDFTPALNAIIEKIAQVLNPCLPRRLNPDADGTVRCEVIERLATEGDVTRCDQVPGRVRVGEEPTHAGALAEVCRVEQLHTAGAVPEGAGWYYDNFSMGVVSHCGDPASGESGQRIAFTEGAQPRNGSIVRLECLQPVQQVGGDAFVDIGSPCAPGAGPETTCAEDTAPPGDPGARCLRDLTCDPASRTWQVVCDSDASCEAGWRCGATGFCLNPTCQ